MKPTSSSSSPWTTSRNGSGPFQISQAALQAVSLFCPLSAFSCINALLHIDGCRNLSRPAHLVLILFLESTCFWAIILTTYEGKFKEHCHIFVLHNQNAFCSATLAITIQGCVLPLHPESSNASLNALNVNIRAVAALLASSCLNTPATRFVCMLQKHVFYIQVASIKLMIKILFDNSAQVYSRVSEEASRLPHILEFINLLWRELL